MSAALALALALPSPVYAMRSVNAGQEDSPVRRALEAGLEERRVVHRMVGGLAVALGIWMAAETSAQPTALQPGTAAQAPAPRAPIMVDPAEWMAVERRLWQLEDAAISQGITLMTRQETGINPAGLDQLLGALSTYGAATFGAPGARAQALPFIIQAQVNLWRSVGRLPPSLRDPLFKHAGGSDYTPERFVRLMYYGLPNVLATHGYFADIQWVTLNRPGDVEGISVPLMHVCPVERAERGHSVTLWGRAVTLDRIVIGPPVVAMGPTTDLAYRAIFGRNVIYSEPQTLAQIAKQLVRNAPAARQRPWQAETAPAAVVRRLTAGESPWAIARTTAEYWTLAWAYGRSAEDVQRIYQDLIEAHEGWHLWEAQHRESLPVTPTLLSPQIDQFKALFDRSVSESERRAERSAIHEGHTSLAILQILGPAAGNSDGPRYQTGYQAELDAWVTKLAQDPARYGFRIIPSPDPRASAENQIRAQLGNLGAPYYEPLVRALVATPEGSAAVLPAVTVPTTWGEKLLWPSLIAGGVAIALGLYGLRWRQQRMAWNASTEKFRGQLNSLLGQEPGQALFKALALDEWHRARVPAPLLVARHAGLGALVVRLRTDAEEKPSRALGLQRGIVASLRRLLDEVASAETRTTLSAHLEALRQRHYPPPAAPPKGGPSTNELRTGLEEIGLTRREFFPTCAIASATILRAFGGPVLDAASLRGAAERAYRAAVEHPRPTWKEAAPDAVERFSPFFARWRAADARWNSLAARVKSAPQPELLQQLAAHHRDFFEQTKQWLAQHGVDVPLLYSQDAMDALILHRLVDFFASQGVAPIGRDASEPIAVGPEGQPQIVHYYAPWPYRIIRARSDGVVEIGLWPGIEATAFHGSVAFKTLFIVPASLDAAVAVAASRRAENTPRFIDAGGLRPFWEIVSAPRGLRVPSNQATARSLLRARLLFQPSWGRSTDGRPARMDERQEAEVSVVAHESQHLEDDTSHDPRIRQMVQADWFADSTARPEGIEAISRVERRGYVKGFAAAPRFYLMQEVGKTDQWLDYTIPLPDTMGVKLAGSYHAARAVFRTIVEEVRRHPARYGVELRSASPIPIESQIIVQLDRLADLAHPERSQQMADVLERQFGMAPAVAAPAWYHRPSTLAVGAAVALGLGAVALWRARRAADEHTRLALQKEASNVVNLATEDALRKHLQLLDTIPGDIRSHARSQMAAAIVSERTARGPFATADQFVQRMPGYVDGVKKSVWQAVATSLDYTQPPAAPSQGGLEELGRPETPTSKRAMIFGGLGNIGRGYLAPLLAADDFDLFLVDLATTRAGPHPLFAAAREPHGQGAYTVTPVGGGSPTPVRHFWVIDAQDAAAVAAQGPRADWIFTAVGSNNIERLAPTFYAFIRQRLTAGHRATLNIVFAENLPVDQPEIAKVKQAVLAMAGVDAPTRDYIEQRVNFIGAGPDQLELCNYVDGYVGFVGAVVHITVPPTIAHTSANPLDIRVEGGGPYYLEVDAQELRDTPFIPSGLKPVENIRAAREKKLLIHNMGHAALAYVSAALGIGDPAEGARDPRVAAVVRQAMWESAQGLHRRHPHLYPLPGLATYVDELIERFGNRELHDTVERIAKDPLRKLAPNDRLFGAALNAQVAGVAPAAIALAIAAALRYARVVDKLSEEQLTPILTFARQHDIPLPADDAALSHALNTFAVGAEEIRIYKAGGSVATYSHGIPGSVFSLLDGVTIKGLRFDGKGSLNIGGRKRVHLKEYPTAPVEVDIEHGKVTEVRVLTETGALREAIPFARIERPDGTLVDTFYAMTAKKLTGLDQVTIRGLKMVDGHLVLGGREWLYLRKYPNAPVAADVQQGKIVEVRVLTETGDVLDTFPFARIERPDGTLVDTFMGALSPRALARLHQVIIKRLHLNSSGVLVLGNRQWLGLDQFPTAPVEVDIEHGKVTEVRVLTETGALREAIPFARIERPDGTLVDTFMGGLAPRALASLDHVTIKGLVLSPAGQLSLGGRAWLRRPSGANAPIEVDIEHGKVVTVRILTPSGTVAETIAFARIERQDGTLVDTFHQYTHVGRLARHGRVTIKKLSLNAGGTLALGRRQWLGLDQFPTAPVEVDIEHGKVTEVRVLTETGALREAIPFARIERPDGTLVDTFYRYLRPPRLARLGRATVKGLVLDAYGRLAFGSRVWPAFVRFPEAEVEVYVENGQPTWVKVIKDRNGNRIDSRVGPGFGQVRRSFYPAERTFRDQLIAGFRQGGMSERQATASAELLVRSKQGSLALLNRDGVLTDAEVQAIAELNPHNVDASRLGARLLTQRSYCEARIRESIADSAQAQSLLDQASTALLPWATIERWQRAYRLGQDLTLIAQALSHPDAEAWIRRVRETQEARGTLDMAKHLSRYTPDHRSSFVEAPGALVANLRSRARVLEALLRNPEDPAYPCSIEVVNDRVAVVRLNVEEAPDLRRSQEMTLIVHGETTSWEVQAYDRDGRRVTLRTAAQAPRSVNAGSSGTLQPVSDVGLPWRQQQEIVQALVTALTRSRGRTTDSLALDRLFGLAPLTSSDPQVERISQFFDPQIPYQQLSKYESQGDRSQEVAVQLAMNPTQVLFIEGPAGTGKTTVIAEILRQAIRQGKKILLVSQMHQAVDNALAAVMDDPAVPALRLGNDPTNFRYGTERIWPGNKDNGVRQKVLGEFIRRLERSQSGCVLASTNSGIASDWFFTRHLERTPLFREGFDLLVMDEASRETVSGALVPLRYLNPRGKAIFVGDARQLPPFGLTDEERQRLRSSAVPEQDVSAFGQGVFEWLIEHGQGDRVMLSTNYRSHPLISGLVSTLFYDGDLHRRGWEDFDAETLSLRVVDVAQEPGVYYESRNPSGSYFNERSATQVVQLVQKYQAQTVPLDQITVITPYTAQVELLERRMKVAFPGDTRPTVTTIDSYQGGENRVIILDFVRSNSRRQIGFVKDVRRLNVGLSRAQESLAIVWDSRTFTGMPSPNDTIEDRAARSLFQRLQDYHGTEVSTFFPEPSPIGDVGNDDSRSGLEERATVAAGRAAVILVKPVEGIAPALQEFLLDVTIRVADDRIDAETMAAQLRRQGITAVRIITDKNFSPELDQLLRAHGFEDPQVRERILQDLRTAAFA